jgi:hypothetical protein
MELYDKRRQGKDTFTLIRLNPETWSKDRELGEFPGGKHFCYYPCRVCGKLISNCGFTASHYQMHEKERIKNEGQRRMLGEISDQNNQDLYWSQCVNQK